MKGTKVRTFKAHLENKLKDEEFKELFEEERQLLDISLRLIKKRNGLGVSQANLDQRAKQF